MFPKVLSRDDHVRIIAPARSMALPFITPAVLRLAEKRLKEMGLRVSFGKHVRERDAFDSSSVASRLADLHDAFADPDVQMVHTIVGGFNSSQLLAHIDYSLIKKNPKILCGYSDITALATAIHVKTGLVTYSGPHFLDFGDLLGVGYTQEYFRKCLFNNAPFDILPSEKWSDDLWANDQKKRHFIRNDGPFSIRSGRAEGPIVGGNLITLQHLAGTPYFPSLRKKILFIEDDHESDANHFESNLTALSLVPEFAHIAGLVIGRFQKASNITPQMLKAIVERNPRICCPVAGGADFGHTTPRFTFPIGGTGKIEVGQEVKITLTKH